MASEHLKGTLTDVAGIKVGHFTDARRTTGCTVILTEEGATAGVDVRGAAPGTRETDVLDPGCRVERVHAILLSGGSAFGLDAAGGVMRWLEDHGFGLPVGPARIPIVPAAILFDLTLGDHRIRPDAAAGYAACAAASTVAVAQGSVGAGAGATIGKLLGPQYAMKGGLGCASIRSHGVTVAALVAVNALGDVIDPSNGQLLAGARTVDGLGLANTADALRRGLLPARPPVGSATTIGVVATDARLDKAQARKMAQTAHDGLARAINPLHTQWDGDTVFALATHRTQVAVDAALISLLAAEVMAQAVINAIKNATRVSGPGVPDLPVWHDFRGR